MKQLINSILFFALLAVAFISCAKNEIEEPGASEDCIYTFSLTNDDTRALIGDDSIEYEAGDALGVFVGATVNTSSAVDVSSTPVIVGVKASQAIVSGDKVYAYYPYSVANVSASASSVMLSIPQQQTQTGDSFDADAMPMVANPYTVTAAVEPGTANPVGGLYMNNLGAIVEFGVYGADFTSEKIQSVTFSSEDAVAGTFKYDLTKVSEQTLSISGLQLQSVKTTLAAVLDVAADKDNAAKVYMVLAPGKYKGHIEVKTDVARYTYTLDQTIVFNRSRVRPLTLNLANATRATEDLLTVIRKAGYNPDDYVQMEVEYTDFAYYHSGNAAHKSAMYTVEADGWDKTICDFVCTPIFSKGDLPEGTLIVQKDGNMYRPEGWVSLDVQNGPGSGQSGYARPDNVNSPVVAIDDAWWGAWNYRAFNLAFSDRRDLASSASQAETLCPQLKAGFGIFVPKAGIDEADMLVPMLIANGYNPEDYIRMEIDYVDFAYYNSSNAAVSRMFNVMEDGWGTTICDFVCTPIYTREDLPEGTLIVQASGFKYRPEGWTALDVRNGSAGTSGLARPDEVAGGIAEVDDAWWGAWNYRAFNLAYEDRRNLASSADAAETLCPKVRSTFGIFVPKNPGQAAKSIKILAIGNSFSMDALEYLYGMLQDVGYEKIVLGNIYKGGCTLATHADYFTNNTAGYTYYLNTTGTWTSTSSSKPIPALDSQDWDFVTMQQGSPDSGKSDTFDPYLSTLVNIVRQHCPGAELVWHMTWAYQQNSTHSGFANYDKNQMTMYNAIVNATKNKILTNSNFRNVIPNGTAVQNMRTSFVGDNLTRDGYHMSYDYGRYLTALTYARTLTGCDLADVTYTPSSYTYSPEVIAAMKDAVNKAVSTPYAVTVSAYPPDPNAFDYATATTEEILAHDGYNPDNYTKMTLAFTNYAYWNSTSNAMGGVYSEKYTAENKSIHTYSNYDEFICTDIIPKSSIPNGSVIVVKGGCKYRPDGWVTLNAKPSSRPSEVTSDYTVQVNDAWWGTLNYRGFNVAFNPRVKLTDTSCGQLRQSFAIYIPKK